MFFGPAWFCIKPCSTVLHVLFILHKNLEKFFKLNEKFIFGSISLAKIQALRNSVLFSFFPQSKSQTLQQNHTVLRRAALSGPERAPDSA
jgi:hypothetical protein